METTLITRTSIRRRRRNNTPAIEKPKPMGFMINYNPESGVMDIILSDKVFSYRVDQNIF